MDPARSDCHEECIPVFLNRLQQDGRFRRIGRGRNRSLGDSWTVTVMVLYSPSRRLRVRKYLGNATAGESLISEAVQSEQWPRQQCSACVPSGGPTPRGSVDMRLSVRDQENDRAILRH